MDQALKEVIEDGYSVSYRLVSKGFYFVNMFVSNWRIRRYRC